ncbi:MAG: response regulator, partial [Chlorobi bacterium]|nr:response regulator [Chlorobiota bacterium]
GKDAVEYCKNNTVDVVLMDLKLPCMSGIEAVRLIKKDNPKLTVIAQTAYMMSAEIDKLIESDFDGYILKPFKSYELIEVIMGKTLEPAF